MLYCIDYEINGQHRVGYVHDFQRALSLVICYKYWSISVGEVEDRIFFPKAIVARSSDFAAWLNSLKMLFVDD